MLLVAAVPGRGVAGDGALLSHGKRNAIAVAALGVSTAALIAFWDDDLNRWAQRSPDTFSYNRFHDLAEVGSWYGKSDVNPVLVFGGVAGAYLAAGALNHNRRATDTAILLTKGYALTLAATFGVKSLTSRSRPETGEGSHRWRGPGFRKSEHRSFPSGHTSTVFLMATIVSHRETRWWVRTLAWTFAAGVAAQRIKSGAHWGSDVLVGGALGYAAGTLVNIRYDTHPRQSHPSGNTRHAALGASMVQISSQGSQNVVAWLSIALP